MTRRWAEKQKLENEGAGGGGRRADEEKKDKEIVGAARGEEQLSKI